RVVREISPPEPVRLLAQAIQPLQAAVFYPLGRISSKPGVDVERRADPDHQGGVQSFEILRHKAFLLRSTQSNPNDVWLALVDPRDQFVLFRRSQWPERRGVGSDDVDRGNENLKPRPQFFYNPVVSAIKK